MIAVTEYYTTKFGELWSSSLYDLVTEAIQGVLTQGSIDSQEIDAVFFGNMMGGVLENNLHASAKISEIMNTHVPVFRLEAACASGGVAFHSAYQYIQSGQAKNVLVIGAEKMTDYSTEKVVTALASAASGEEQEAGLTFPGLYAMLARYYMNTYGLTEREMAEVSVKNHFHGTLNKKAQFQMKLTVEDVMKSPYVANPIKVLDSSPITDGAAALLLTSDPVRIKKSASAHVLSTQIATDSISLAKRKYLDRLEAAEIAAKKAYAEAKIKPNDIDIAELHDCFSIAEILAMEDLGFYKQGQAGHALAEKHTQIGNGNGLTINTSGGLKAAGHPVGATGIKQIGEVYLQLTQQAENRQVPAHIGLAHNVGGSGGTAVVTILGETT